MFSAKDVPCDIASSTICCCCNLPNSKERSLSLSQLSSYNVTSSLPKQNKTKNVKKGKYEKKCSNEIVNVAMGKKMFSFLKIYV